MRILIVEDSKRLAESLRLGLRKLGHAVDLAHDGETGLHYARSNPYTAIILDRMLPGLDGLELLQALRKDQHDVRVLMLTARDTVADRVAGLKEGADDYLVKPFSFDELVARLEALSRRPERTASLFHSVGDLFVDTRARTVQYAGRPIWLSPREYELLVLLMSNRGKVVTRIEIEDHLYDERSFPSSNVVESAISSLRAKLGASGARPLIHTRRGHGYVLDEEPA